MFLDKFKLDGKTALVTGGTRGIGLSIAHALGEAGAKLVLVNRTDPVGGVQELKDAGYDVSFFEGDLLDRSVPQKTVDFTLEKHGRLDILVNNAGVAQHGDTEKFNDDFFFDSDQKIGVKIIKEDGEKCPRCWRLFEKSEITKNNLCYRCDDLLNAC